MKVILTFQNFGILILQLLCLHCFRYFVAFALDTIAGTAFGIQIDSQKDLSNPFVVNSSKLFSNGFIKNKFLLLSGEEKGYHLDFKVKNIFCF